MTRSLQMIASRSEISSDILYHLHSLSHLSLHLLLNHCAPKDSGNRLYLSLIGLTIIYGHSIRSLQYWTVCVTIGPVLYNRSTF